MQTVDKNGKKEWTKDKSGKLFTKMVTIPMLNTLDTIIRTFIEYKETWQKKNFKNLKNSHIEYLMDARSKCGEILNDIKYDSLIKPILREVAPCFEFNDYLKIKKAPQKNVEVLEYDKKNEKSKSQVKSKGLRGLSGSHDDFSDNETDETDETDETNDIEINSDSINTYSYCDSDTNSNSDIDSISSDSSEGITLSKTVTLKKYKK